MDKKRKYIAPEVSVDKYEAEEGYAGSLRLFLDNVTVLGDDNSGIEQWTYQENDETFGSTSFTWQ